MERSKAKEAGRKKAIRDKANALKDKPPRKAPTKEVIKKAGRYHAIEAAKKQLSEAQQAIVPDQEQQPYTAVDKVEAYSANAAHEVLQALPSAGKPRQHPDNSFHAETHFEPPDAPTTKAQMMRAFVWRLREQEQQAARNTPASEVQKKFSETATRRDMKTPARKRGREYRGRTKESVFITSTTGQRHRAMPRDISAAAAPKSQLVKEQGRRLARDRAIREIQTGTASNLSGKAAKASGDFFKKLGAAVTKAVTPSRETLLYAVLILVPFVVIMGVASMLTSSGEGRSAYIPISAEVEAYRPLVRLYAAQYGIPEYEDLIAAVMMQESGGRGSDPMQCSESGYNTRYPHAPNSITDPEYSIDVGVHTLADVLSMAAVESPIDLDRISLALQGYNFGPGYISWALANYGGYSELNAIEFSNMMAARYGWAGYGDKAYVSHVLRYYVIGR